MGSNCGKGIIVSVHSSPTKKRKQFVPPEPIWCISGVSVSRECPWYQYALFCCTRLMDKYKDFMFPNVTMSLGSFREDLQDYMDVIEEIYHDLCFEERLMANGRVSFETDNCAKAATSQLAFRLWKLTTNYKFRKSVDLQEAFDKLNDSSERVKMEQNSAYDGVELSKLYEEEKVAIQDSESYRYCYEDTLKLLITDLERKEIWQISTLYSNKAFEEHLRLKEPETHRELTEDSVTISVPRPLARKTSKLHSRTLSEDEMEFAG